MRKLFTYAFALIAGTFVGLALSDGAVWHLTAGPPDLGRADFAALPRPANQFVACPADDAACPEPNITIATIADAPETVLAKLVAKAESESRVFRVDDDTDPMHRRYVARSTLLKFPDTISITAVPNDAGTDLRISSRSQIGQSDFGVNGERVKAWLAAL